MDKVPREETASRELMREGIAQAAALDLAIIQHCEDPVHGRGDVNAGKVADATGLSLATLRAGQHRAEINEVLSTAHERAERKGTTVEEEVPVVAKQRAKMREADKKRTATRKAKHGFRYIEIEGHLAAAQRRLSQALSTAQDVAWDDEEIELLTDSLGKIRAVLNLIDMRIAGETDVNWDAELASLTKET